MRGFTILAIFTTSTLLCGAVATRGEDFRVDSKVFQGKDVEPHSTNTTVFAAGAIYDFSEKPSETTVYIPRLKKVILLDHARKLKVEISTEQLERFSAQLKMRAEKATDPALKFLLAPEFKTSRGSGSGNDERIFQSDYVTYQCETFTPRSPVVAQQYREFGDLSAQLNAVLNRGWPPFARMQVNAALADEKLIPRKVAFVDSVEIVPRRSATTLPQRTRTASPA